MTTELDRIESTEQERSTFNDSDSSLVPPPDIVAYNELRSCADLYRMYRDGILEISPGFQREIVWQTPAQTRFLDSLIKQLPIPSMCFSLDYRTQKWQVIDGLQRMWSIIEFLGTGDWRLSRLDDIDPAISGRQIKEFRDSTSELNQYYKRIENLTVPVTVIRCDYRKESHMEYLFTIFHRLNRGAIILNNQEIRNCIFSGKLNDLLRELDDNKVWLNITGRSSNTRDRYRGQEMILRFFTFHDNYQDYTGRLAAYLNEYMKDNREPPEDFLDEKRRQFDRTTAIVDKIVREDSQQERIRLSVLEAVMVGVALNIDKLETVSSSEVLAMYHELLISEEFSEENLREGLSGRQRVLDRMSAAAKVFAG